MTEVIASPQNKLIKEATALKQKKYRDELGLFAVEGVRLCEEMAAADWQSSYCLYTAEAAENDRVAAILRSLAAQNCRTYCTTAAVFAKVADTEQPQGIMIVGRKKDRPMTDLFAGRKEPLIAVLDSLQDPGNVGTVIRTADAAGCSGIALVGDCADLYSGKTLRATMGSVFHLPVVEVTRTELVTVLRKMEVTLYATALEIEALPYTAADLAGPCAIAFGNEGRGLSPDILASAKQNLYIPLYGQAESLNVAASAAVVLYEAARQRQSACNLPIDML
jgi:TrmH family RNA methyltransferase